ncbi:MAG: Gfo/Idh/MocA family oxidoreductase [Verrucomicrobiota bacterium]
MNMTSTEIRIGMIGCSARARSYLRSIAAVPGCRLTSLCDLIPERARKLKAQAGNERLREYTDYRRMLDAGEMDAVFVVTEPEYQAGISVACMEAGLHVLSEVPATYSLDECWRIVIAAERTGRRYYLGEQVRHAPFVRYWRQWVQGEVLGSILFAEGHYLHGMGPDRAWINPETGERLTWEQSQKLPGRTKSRLWSLKHPIFYGPHEMSPILKMLDDRVVRVTGYSSGLPSKRYKETPFPCMDMEFTQPDFEAAMMQTAKGTIVRFAAGFQVPASECHWYHLFGTKGELETRRGADEPGYSYLHPAPVMNDGMARFPRTRQTWFHSCGRPPRRGCGGAGAGRFRRCAAYRPWRAGLLPGSRFCKQSAQRDKTGY